MLDVQTNSDGRRTNYVITGSKEQVEQAIERVERAYHPLGYGTTFRPLSEIEPGKWSASGYRYNSCD